MEAVHTQRDKVIRLLSDRTMARAHEIRMEGITATTLARAVEDGKVLRVARGLYQLPHAEVDPDIALAEVSKRIPKGRICMCF